MVPPSRPSSRPSRRQDRSTPPSPPSSSSSTSFGSSSKMALVSSLLALPLLVSGQSSSSSSLPQVNFAKMGSVALGGSFSGLDFYSPSTSSSSSSTNITYSSSASTLVLRSSSTSTITPLAQTEQGGTIEAVCFLPGVGGSNGTVFVGGKFEELGGVKSRNVASVDVETGVVSSLGAGGVEGESIYALYCDESTSIVWIGGELTTPVGEASPSSSSSSYGGGVLQYLPSSNTFTPAPFTGLSSGSVQSISQSPSNSSLLFTGSFSLSYSGSSNLTSPTNSSSNSTTQFSPSGLPLSNVTILSSGATAFSSTLSPIPLLGAGVLIDAEPTTTVEGYTDPSVLFCPTGDDGINHTWLGRDGGIAQINVQVYRDITASGIRVGNTFVNGRGTSAFSFVSVPDNTLLSLSYLDPVTGTTQTCSTSCPLSLNSSIPFQDFLFADGGRDITGFQIILLEWREEGPGLHLLELLSDGAYASAASSGTSSCSSIDSPTNSTLVGTWNEITINTSIGGTTTTALQSIIPSSEIATLSTPPSVTFQPYLSGTGNYTVNVLIPGCLNVGDCSSRTSLDVSIQPYQGAGLWTSTIPPSQQDLTFLLYEGAMQKTEVGGFSPTVVLAMSSTPVGVNDDEYSIVANRVEFTLTTLDTTGTGSNSSSTGTGGLGGSGVNGTSGTNSSSTVGGFGVYEWTRSTESNATGLLSNTTQTPFDKLAVALASALKASSSSSIASNVSISSAILVDSTYYIAGSFESSTFANIVSYDGTAFKVLPNAGLNGRVHSLARVGTKVYVGGEFTRIATPGRALLRLAAFDTSTNAWESLGGGVDGSVTGLVVSGTNVYVSGNFSTLLAANSSSSSVASGGFAVWDTTSSTWVSQQSVVLGDVATVGAGSGGDAFFAGNIVGAAGFGAEGFVMLSSKSDGSPEFNAVPLSFASSSASSSSANETTVTRRTLSRRSPGSTSPSWLSMSAVVIKRAFLLPRQTSSSSNPNVPAIPRSSTPAPAILAAAFWTNSSESGNPSVAVVGGNFSSNILGSSASTSSNNVALYDPSTKTVRALEGGVVNGVVLALAVVGDRVFVGGEFRVNSTNGLDEEGLAIWDLKQRQWVAGELPGLSASTGSNVSVHVLAQRGTSSTLIVAGSFAEAGSLPCASICAWDTTEHQWSSLQNGLSGEIRALDFAGASSEILVVAGSFSLPSSSTASFVAQYSFANSSWSALGDSSSIPGPATAISVDNKNASNIFIAGTSTTSNASYLLRWDGSSWSSPTGTSSLESTSVVQQLSFVPLSEAHDGNSVMEEDRMLMVSGALALTGQGTFSSALYDGNAWHPYVKSTGSDGSPGAVSGVFNSDNSFSFSIRHFLARGIVVLICLAIATGLIFLFVLIGVLIAVWRRRNEENRSYPVGKEGDGRDSYSDINVPANGGSSRTRSALLDHIDLATAGVITGGATAGGAAAFAQHEKNRTMAQSEYEHNPMSESTAVAGAGGYSEEQYEEEQEDEEEEEEEGEPRTAVARWSLEPDVGAERELRIQAGKPYIILNDTSGEWWLAMDPETGEQGAVPASWML